MAIAFDASTTSNTVGTTLTFSHTVTGTNNFLVVDIIGAQASPGDVITGVTYNSVSMTQQQKLAPGDGSDRWSYTYTLVNPATGAHNVVVSMSSSTFMLAIATSYNGAKQTGQPDVKGTTSTGVVSTSFSHSLTTVTANAWLHALIVTQLSNPLAGSGTVLRSASGMNLGAFDSGGSVGAAGSHSLNYTSSVNTDWRSLMIGIADDGIAAPSNAMFMGANI